MQVRRVGRAGPSVSKGAWLAAGVLLVAAVVTRDDGGTDVDAAPAAATGRPTSTTTERSGRSPSAPVAVRSVTDGDTIVLADGRRVRLAQVDAPETHECFGSESTAALTRLVDGKRVTLRQPSNGPAKDKYGRTLAELTVDGVSVDEELVRSGAAEWYERFAHEDADIARRLEAAEADARAAGRGLWSACRTDDTPPPAPTTTTTVTSPPPTATPTVPPRARPATPSTSTATAPPTTVARPESTDSGCHPAYPDECIPPPPPDLDCPDIGHRVRVDRTHGDPHRLDSDGDGWGCESFG